MPEIRRVKDKPFYCRACVRTIPFQRLIFALLLLSLLLLSLLLLSLLLLLLSLSLYERRSSVSTTAVVATQDPWRRLPTKAEAACRRPQSFLRKSNGDGLSHGPDEDNVICRDGVNRSDSIRYFVALLYDHVSEPQYLPPSEHRLMAALRRPCTLEAHWPESLAAPVE